MANLIVDILIKEKIIRFYSYFIKFLTLIYLVGLARSFIWLVDKSIVTNVNFNDYFVVPLVFTIIFLALFSTPLTRAIRIVLGNLDQLQTADPAKQNSTIARLPIVTIMLAILGALGTLILLFLIKKFFPSLIFTEYSWQTIITDMFLPLFLLDLFISLSIALYFGNRLKKLKKVASG